MFAKPTRQEMEKRIEELEKAEHERRSVVEEQRIVLKVLDLINDTESLEELLGAILSRLKRWTGCEAVGIRLKDGHDFPYYVTDGFPEEFVRKEKHLCIYDKNGNVKRDENGNPMLECMCGNILTGRVDPSKNFFTEDGSFWSNCTSNLLATTTEKDRQTRTRNRCNSEGYESVALIPLRSAGETFGLVQLNDSRKGMFSTESIAMYRRIANHVASFLAKRQAREALQKSERQLKALINTLPDLVWLKDPDGVYMACNPRFEKFFGAKESEIVGKTDYDFLDSEMAHFFREKDRSAIAAGKPIGNEEEVTFACDGHHEILETIKSPFYSDKGELDGVVGIARDITPRKQAERMLLESKEQLRLFIAHTPAAIAMFDRQMRYLAVSSRWIEDYHLRDAKNIIGKSHYDVFPEIPQHWKEIHQKGMAGEVSRMDEEYFQRLDGTVNCLLWEVRPWYKMDGSVGGIIILTEDITRRKTAEKDRKKLQDLLTQSQKMESIGRLAGGIAHDLNNLLSPILGYSEMMAAELETNDNRKNWADEILKAGIRARDLVRQLLAFSRKQTLEFNSVDVGVIVHQFKSLLRRTIPEDIQIDLILSKDTPTILADVGQLEQVIMNLAVNAADAMPNGGVLSIETKPIELDEAYAAIHPGMKPGPYVMLSISDTGQGMDEETRKKVFEPFFTTKGESGTGLGLATVYGIVKQHDGNIWVYSEPGEGTTIKIFLPVAPQTIEKKGTAPKTDSIDIECSETILLVEDNDQVRRLAQAILTNHGYKVIATKNSDEALI